MIQRRETSECNLEITTARRSAQYFIDRGFDAQGERIKNLSAYMDAAIRNVKRRSA